MTGSFYDFHVKESPDTCTQVYVAKILGGHPEYKFRREFVPLTRSASSGGSNYIADVEDFGVYEKRVKWFEAEPDGVLVDRERTWFLMFDGVDYEIKQDFVMDTWRWLTKFLAGREDDAE